MNTKEVYLGIDTSCYTTSLMLLNRAGEPVGEARRILTVKPGRCGLQQSEMVYQHTRNLPELMEQATRGRSLKLLGIAASSQPRPTEESYMPAFLAGMGLARSLAALQGIPLHLISHQENHLEAGVWSAGGPKAEQFLMLHASGGTTDLLLASRGTSKERYQLKQIGGSIDLHAGQFIDRVGVALGLQFPTGPALEQLALTAEGSLVELPVSVNKLQVSLSGPATAALRKLKAGCNRAELAQGVQYALAETFTRMLRNAGAAYGVSQVLLVGGVASNSYIRQHVIEKLAKRRMQVWIPEARYSCDNAGGCAAFAWRQGEQ